MTLLADTLPLAPTFPRAHTQPTVPLDHPQHGLLGFAFPQNPYMFTPIPNAHALGPSPPLVGSKAGATNTRPATPLANGGMSCFVFFFSRVLRVVHMQYTVLVRRGIKFCVCISMFRCFSSRFARHRRLYGFQKGLTVPHIASQMVKGDDCQYTGSHCLPTL